MPLLPLPQAKWSEPPCGSHGTEVASIIGAANNGSVAPSASGPSWRGTASWNSRITFREQRDSNVFRASYKAGVCHEGRVGIDGSGIIASLQDIVRRNATGAANQVHVLNASFAREYLDDAALANGAAYDYELFRPLEATTLVVAGAGNQQVNAERVLPASLSQSSYLHPLHSLTNLVSVGATAVDGLDGTPEPPDSRAIWGGTARGKVGLTPHLTILRTLDCTPVPLAVTPQGSNCGDAIDLVAPGEDVWAVKPSGYGPFQRHVGSGAARGWRRGDAPDNHAAHQSLKTKGSTTTADREWRLGG